MAIQVGQIRKDPNADNLNNITNPYLEAVTITPSRYKKEGGTFTDLALEGSWQDNITYYVKVKIKRVDIYEDMGNPGAGDNDPHNLNIDVKLYPENSDQYQSIGEPISIDPYFHEGANQDLDNETAFLEWCNQHLNFTRDDSSSQGNEILLPTQMVGYNYQALSSTIEVNEEESLPEDSPIKTYYNELVRLHELKSSVIVENKGMQNSEYEIIELVFTPYVDAKYLVFELRRVAYDYSTTTPRIVEQDLAEAEAYIIKNIFPNNFRAKKIGVQTKPGTLVVVNSAPMRVGKSGVLEIDVGIDIGSVGFAAAHGKINDFILDYIYET